MNIARLLPSHANAYRELMLEAYAAHPEAFTSSAEERAALPMSWWEARLSDEAGATSVVIGALDGGQLSGVVGILFESRVKLRHVASLFGMYVRPAVRRSGVGRALVNAAVEHARMRPLVRNVQLTVTEGNPSAEALYARCGFVRWGVQPDAVAVGETLLGKVHMSLDLGKRAMAPNDERSSTNVGRPQAGLF